MTAEEILNAKGCAVGIFDYQAFNAVVTKFFLEKDGVILYIHSRQFDLFSEKTKSLGFLEDINGKYKEMFGESSRTFDRAFLIWGRDKKYNGKTIADVIADLYDEGAADAYLLYMMLSNRRVESSIVINSTVYDRVKKALKKQGFVIGKNQDYEWICLP